MNGQPVSHIAQYEGVDGLVTTELVLKAETYATSEAGAAGAWLLIEKVSLR